MLRGARERGASIRHLMPCSAKRRRRLPSVRFLTCGCWAIERFNLPASAGLAPIFPYHRRSLVKACFSLNMHGDSVSGVSRSHEAGLEPVRCACIHRGGDDLRWQAVNRCPCRAAIGGIRWKTHCFYWPVILAFQSPNDGGKRDTSAQRRSAGLVCIGKQDREHGATCGTRAGKNGRLGRHSDDLTVLTKPAF